MTPANAPLFSPSRRRSLIRLAWGLDTAAGRVAMFALALLVRVLIAPRLGFYGDLRLFKMWATQLDEVGLHRFYAQGQFADYPPGYLYVLWLLGKLSAAPGYLLLQLPLRTVRLRRILAHVGKRVGRPVRINPVRAGKNQFLRPVQPLVILNHQ